MSIVKDLNLKPDGKQSLRDFYAEKAPSKQWSQIVAFIYYLEKVLQVESITANHVFSCFKDVGVRAPSDTVAAIRKTANRYGFVDSSKQSQLKVTVPGENYVEHDLPDGENGIE